MSTTYHISPNGPRLCKSTQGRCPYALAGEEHYNSQAEAQAAYETKMSETFGTLDSLKRTAGEKLRQKSYGARDSFVKAVKGVKASPPVQKVHGALAYIRNIPRRIEGAYYNAQMRALTRHEEARQRQEALKESIQNLERELRARTPAPPAQQERVRELNSIARPAPRSRVRFNPAYKLSKGDIVLNGDERLYVAKVTDMGDSVKVQYRSLTTGRFAGGATLSDTDVVAVHRPGKRDLRGQAKRQLKKLSESNLFQRVKAASQAQKEVLQVLRGVDLSKVERVKAPAPRDRRKAPLDQRFRRAVATAEARTKDVDFALYAAKERVRNRRRSSIDPQFELAGSY